MPFLRSLICIVGFDNGRRFLAISAVLYLLLLLFLPVYPRAGILVFLLLIVATPIMIASSIRRIHDAGFMTSLAVIPAIIFWLNVFGLIYLDHSAKWILLVLGVIATVIISTISNIKVRHNNQYQLGYLGPVNSANTNNNNDIDRVEPTLATSVFENLNQNDLESHILDSNPNKQVYNSNEQSINSSNQSLKEQAIHWFKLNKNLALAGLSLSLLAILLILFIPKFFNAQDATEIKKEPTQSKIEFKKERLHKLEMPDNFWLMLDQNNALTIGWEGDFKKDGSYWSAMTGKGDKTCSDLHFSLGEDIRTLAVTVKVSEDYYADFSPIDTNTIIKSIADKDRFKLCGYEFELKGTRSLLRKHEFYRANLNPQN